MRMLKNPVESAAESEALTRVLKEEESRMAPDEDEEDETPKMMVQLPSRSDGREAQELRLHSTKMLKLPLDVLKELAETRQPKARGVGGGWESNPEAIEMFPEELTSRFGRFSAAESRGKKRWH